MRREMTAVTYRDRLTLLVLLDSIIICTAIFVALWMVHPNGPEMNGTVMLATMAALLVFHHLYASIYKLYNKVWTYASVGELRAIVKAVTLSVISAGIVQFVINDFTIYRWALLVTWLLYITFIGGSRFMWRIYRDRYIKGNMKKKRTLIVGAGDAGAMVVRQLTNHNNEAELKPVAFIDDDIAKQRMQLYNLPVLGKVKDIPNIVEAEHIDHIVIAIPSLHNGELNKIVTACNKSKAKVQMIPKIEDLMTGKVSVNNLKNVEVEDLLGRDPVNLDIDAISSYVTDKTVMVTGAGGSIGSELCRQIMRFSPDRIILVGHGEFSIYTIDMELRAGYKDLKTDIIPVIADVQDRERIFEIVNTYKPTIIYHAAAHKHVPLMEYNPHEAVKNNIIGTKNVADAAHDLNIDTFVLDRKSTRLNSSHVANSYAVFCLK